jgi:hypothetical protein
MLSTVDSRTGKHRPPLYDPIIEGHRDMRSRLKALNQARHEGYDPAEVETVRRALWAIDNAGRSS